MLTVRATMFSVRGQHKPQTLAARQGEIIHVRSVPEWCWDDTVLYVVNIAPGVDFTYWSLGLGIKDIHPYSGILGYLTMSMLFSSSSLWLFPSCNLFIWYSIIIFYCFSDIIYDKINHFLKEKILSFKKML